MSGDRRDDDAGAIAWPGFVDILSSVMIMFLFFMLITSIVMFGMNIEYRKKVKKETEEKFSALVSEELRDKLKELLSGGETVEEILKKLENQNQLEKLQVENTDLSKEVTELQKVVEQVKKDVSTGASQNTKVGDDDSLLIIYDNNDVTLSEQTTKVIEAYIEGIKKKNEGKRLTIRVLSSDNPNAASISLSREISLSRSLNVRNVLMKSAIDTKDIDISYSIHLSMDDTFIWLNILVEVEDDP